MFRLFFLKDGEKTFNQPDPKKSINIKPTGRTTGWFQGAGRFSTKAKPMVFKIVSIRGKENGWSPTVIPTLVLIDRWGAMGSRTQHGFGVVNIDDEKDNRIKATNLDFHLKGSKYERSLPNIKDFFFSKVAITPQIDDNHWIKKIDGLSSYPSNPFLRDRIQKMPDSLPSAPAVKNWLRYTFFPALKKKLPAVSFPNDGSLFGQAMPQYNKQASKIAVSDMYRCKDRWEFRIWGWIPTDENSISLKARNKFLDELKETISSSPAELKKVLGNAKVILHEWRQFDSGNDTSGRESDFLRYFKSLTK